MSTINEFFELVKALYQLGQELPHYLLILSEVADPTLSPDLRTPVLGKLFEEVPRLLSNINEAEFHQMLGNLPQDAVPLRMLVSFHKVSMMFQQLSRLQILQLTNNLIPPGPSHIQASILSVAQTHIQNTWTLGTASMLHEELKNSPISQERRKLLELQPRLPWELLQFFMEMIKLPKEESLEFFKWFVQLNNEQIYMLAQILQFDTSVILEYKRRLTLPTASFQSLAYQTYSDDSLSASTSSTGEMGDLASYFLQPELSEMEATGYSINTPASLLHHAQTPPVVHVSPMVNAVPPMHFVPQPTPQPATPLRTSASGMLVPHSSEPTMRIVKQPDDEAVYNRIIKPAPTIMLVGPNAQSGAVGNYFVDATLVRADSDVEMSACLEGTRVERVSNGVFATFKRLKITHTTQQQGTLFRLKFVLKKYIDNDLRAIPGSVIYSDNIEVFSHGQYLKKNRSDYPNPPMVEEVLPPNGVLGTRVCILGANFINSPNLVIRFGDSVAAPVYFHEKGTVICSVPPRSTPQASVSVEASNDGVNFGDTRVKFIYLT